MHPAILGGERLPDNLLDEKTVWHDRYRSIVHLEKHLHSNGTRIIKFYLHLSKEEQRKRFLQRIVEPEKNWKFSLADVEERKFWKQYMKAYEKCLSATSTRDAPWYVVPARFLKGGVDYGNPMKVTCDDQRHWTETLPARGL